jgi:hypothetical protein
MLLTKVDLYSALSKHSLHFCVARLKRHGELQARTFAGLQRVALPVVIDLTHKVT